MDRGMGGWGDGGMRVEILGSNLHVIIVNKRGYLFS